MPELWRRFGARALKRRDGVEEVSFDRDTAEVVVRYDPARTRPELLVEAIADLGYGAEIGEGKGCYLPDVEFPPELDVRWISRDGAAVDIERHVERGKVTVFDFYATWCGPCREVDREMLSILRESSDVALRKLNVADWGSGVAKQYLTEVPNLPYVIVYGKDGERVAGVSGLELERLRSAIDKGRRE